ncbi:hypothetical protein Tco_1328296 [Tanacetum coccineum]
MANQEQNLPQQEQPFVAAKQVIFILEDIILNTNNEVNLLYLEHTNKDYFKCVFDFISKCCLRKPFTKFPNMYQEYLAEFWYSAKALENSKVSFTIPTGGIYGEVGLNIFRNVIGAHYLPHSSEYVAPPFIDIVRKWFPTIGYGEEVFTKGTLRKNLLPPSLANGINIHYVNIFWEDIILKPKKKQREKTLKPNQPEEPPFTYHILAICNAKEPVALKAPKPSSIAERVPQGTKPGAQPGHKKQPSSKQTSVSNKEATKGGSSKAPTGSKTGHSKRRKESSSAMDSNPSRPSVSTPVDIEMHKEDQQATGGPTSLGVTSEERAHPQLSSADSTAEADPRLSAPNDSIPPQQGMDEGTKNTSYDHIFAGINPHVLADQTKSVSEGLETILTQPTTKKGASSTAIHGDKEEASTAIYGDKEEASSTINLEDLAKLVSQIHPSFKDLDSPKDDPLEPEKNKAKAEAALLKAQPSFPNVEQINDLLVKSLQTEFSKILSSYDFSSSFLTKLKDLPSKFNELTEEIEGLNTQVHELEIELPKELKEIPTKLENFTKTATSLTSQVAELKTLQWELLEVFLSLPAKVESTQAKLKTLDALPSLLLNVTKALNKFVEVLESTSTKVRDQSVPSAGQADTMPAEGEKDTNQATISQLFQRRADKIAET